MGVPPRSPHRWTPRLAGWPEGRPNCPESALKRRPGLAQTLGAVAEATALRPAKSWVCQGCRVRLHEKKRNMCYALPAEAPLC
jgi:hypothetical protein